MSEPSRVRILCVCLGNICRSPAAEGVLRLLVRERGLDGIVEVDSAGTGSWHVGEPADERMRRAAAARGFALESTGRQVRRGDLERYDLILAMDRSNLRELEQLAGGPRPHVRLLGSFLPAAGEPDVPDPYYGGERGFDEVLDLLEEAAEAALDEALALAGRAEA
jgi:protein-tyrosine phosphatase